MRTRPGSWPRASIRERAPRRWPGATGCTRASCSPGASGSRPWPRVRVPGSCPWWSRKAERPHRPRWRAGSRSRSARRSSVSALTWTRRRCAGCSRPCGAWRDRGPAGRTDPARGRAGRLQEGHGRAGRPGAAGAAGRPVRGRGHHLPSQAGRPGEDPGLRRHRPGFVREEAGGRTVLLAVAGRGGGALERGVTIMAKWNDRAAGSSCHIHSSLWGTGRDTPASADPKRPHGMSAAFEHWLAGQVALAREMTAFLAPYPNSYKRFQAGSFAPTKLVWSVDNRTAAFRAMGSGRSQRVECRVPGADVNPYLAYAALIAAGLHGIENALPLDPPAEGNAYLSDGVPEIPTTLRDAATALDGSAVLREVFGDGVVDHYVRAARWEQAEADRRVTDWEVARYFERV